MSHTDNEKGAKEKQRKEQNNHIRKASEHLKKISST